jgi:hypothetical protein
MPRGASGGWGLRSRCRSGRGADSARRHDRRQGSALSGDASGLAPAAARPSAARGLPPAGLFAYRPAMCSAAGISSPGTHWQAGARPVVTSTGTVPARSARVTKRRAAARSRLAGSRTPMTQLHRHHVSQASRQDRQPRLGNAPHPPVRQRPPTGTARTARTRPTCAHPTAAG